VEQKYCQIHSVADMLNSFFVEAIDLLSENNAKLHKQRMNCCPKTIFLYPANKYEIEQAI
jgi:GTP cyclohydrolase II